MTHTDIGFWMIGIVFSIYFAIDAKRTIRFFAWFSFRRYELRPRAVLIARLFALLVAVSLAVQLGIYLLAS